ncbi:MAG: DUF971 domain-containing protein [Ignavibacteriae bacterium]|nr:MAG: DUF971 domain-containing protein [Ignavibacteriota bacterium]
MQLIQFKRNEDEQSIHLKFDDGFEKDITLQELRDNCPCASCKGEEVLLHKYVPQKQKISNLGYMLDRAEPVGTYAIKLFWRDRHDTGIYSWEYLRKLAEKKA